jgi:hypothetical protein
MQCFFFCHLTHWYGVPASFSTDFQSFNPIETFDVQGSSRDFLAYKYNTIQYNTNIINYIYVKD